MNNFKTKLITLLLAAGSCFLVAAPVGAIDIINESCSTNGSAKICEAEDENIGNSNFVRNVVNTLLYLLGAAAVIVIIIGGITYATANGDAGRIKQAKNIIMYAVIGLGLAIMAWGIVAFVVGAFN